MIFSNKKNIDNLNIRINGIQIDQVYVSKFLGVQIDSKLTWKSHIDYTGKKLSKSSGIISKDQHVLKKDISINFYYTFAYSYLIYFNEIWGSTYQTHLDRLLKIQKRLLRIITSSDYYAHTAPMFKKNKILDIYQINKYLLSVFMYKYYHNDLSEVFIDMYITSDTTHTYSTRQKHLYHIPLCRTESFKKKHKISWSYYMEWIAFWN